ncbi:MAG: hypothetical protein V3U30_02015 [Thermoplasmata archaeon]
MANADHLVLAIGVGAILITITVGAVLYQPPPQVDIRLVTSEESYRLGQWVDVQLENRGPFTLCTHALWPWGIARQVDDEWRGVATITMLLEWGRGIGPGGTLRWGWVAENEPYWEESGFPEVLPGEYRFGFRGWLCGDMAPEPTQHLALFAHFKLVE